jgi:hypothetical protein
MLYLVCITFKLTGGAKRAAIMTGAIRRPVERHVMPLF